MGTMRGLASALNLEKFLLPMGAMRGSAVHDLSVFIWPRFTKSGIQLPYEHPLRDFLIYFKISISYQVFDFRNLLWACNIFRNGSVLWGDLRLKVFVSICPRFPKSGIKLSYQHPSRIISIYFYLFTWIFFTFWNWTLTLRVDFDFGIAIWLWDWNLILRLDFDFGIGLWFWDWTLTLGLDFDFGIGLWLWDWTLTLRLDFDNWIYSSLWLMVN